MYSARNHLVGGEPGWYHGQLNHTGEISQRSLVLYFLSVSLHAFLPSIFTSKEYRIHVDSFIKRRARLDTSRNARVVPVGE